MNVIPKPKIPLEDRIEIEEALHRMWQGNCLKSRLFAVGKIESYTQRGFNTTDYQFELLQYAAYMSGEPMAIGLNGS